MLEIMGRLFTEDHVTFEGEHYTLHDVSINPKPVQQPLPCWIGGSSRAAIERTARYGDGWLAGLQSPAQIRPVVEALRTASAEAGRPLDPDHFGAGMSFRFGSVDEPVVQRALSAFSRLGPGIDPQRVMAVGDAAAIIERCREYHAAGISKFVMRPLATDDADTMVQTRRLIGEVMPEVHSWPNALEPIEVPA
jgi:alkanesulfonate monooxygenase SsuD/methylene tetrahydromethanopterin reductase-like flavin-dependent oxidoreductase (luciferase family)